MPRTWTEEQKQEARERLAAARAKKAANKATEEQKPEQPAINTGELGVPELTRMVLELQQAIAMGRATQGLSTAQVANGRLVGVQEKYSTDKSRYEDPRPRLLQEPRLKRVAFAENYEVDYEVTSVTYETKTGITEKQPKFAIELIQVVLDDRGEPTNRRIGVAKLVFFEDPDTAIKIAEDNGLEVNEANQIDFLNDMRYLRVRDWIFECFWPTKPDATKNNRKEMVVGGQVVQTWEVSSPADESAKIPFSELGNSKLRA